MTTTATSNASTPMTPNEIRVAAQQALARRFGATADDLRKLDARGVEHSADDALRALRDLVVGFLTATDKGCPESMKTMSIEQIQILNKLYLAVGIT